MITTFIFFLCITKVKIGTYNNPLTYYLVFWVWWILVSFQNPFGLYSVSVQAYLLIWTNILFFSIGYVLVCKRKSFNTYFMFSFNNKREYAFILLQLIILFIIAYYYLKYNHLLNLMKILDVRRIKYEPGLLFLSYTESTIYRYFIASFLYLSVVINISKYVMKFKVGISGIITIISVILFGLTGLGRFMVFNSIVFFVIAIGLKKQMFIQKESNQNLKKNKTNKSNKLRYLLFVYAGLVYMVLITGRRWGKVVSGATHFIELFRFSVEKGIVYFVGPFRAFDNFLNLRIYDGIGYTFGRSTFSGLDEIFRNFTIIITGLNVTSANDKMASFTVDPIYIGIGQPFNAFYTGVMNSYLDGGIFSVIILAFLYGSVAALVWNHYNKYPNLFSFSLLIYFTHTTIASEYRLAFSAPSTWVILFVLIFYCNWTKRTRNNLRTHSFDSLNVEN